MTPINVIAGDQMGLKKSKEGKAESHRTGNGSAQEAVCENLGPNQGDALHKSDKYRFQSKNTKDYELLEGLSLIYINSNLYGIEKQF